MTRRPITLLASLITGVALILAACSPADASQAGLPAEAPSPVGGEELARLDEQGAVSVRVVPLNLAEPGTSLDFEVALDTHSVDLGMDLTGLASLTTDLGLTVDASRWDAPRGGHHVEGVLSFPASSGGKELVTGASRLSLTLRGLDVPERTFEWALPAE